VKDLSADQMLTSSVESLIELEFSGTVSGEPLAAEQLTGEESDPLFSLSCASNCLTLSSSILSDS